MEKKAEKGIARAVGMEMQGIAAVLLPALGKVSWREGLKCSAEELPPPAGFRDTGPIAGP